MRPWTLLEGWKEGQIRELLLSGSCLGWAESRVSILWGGRSLRALRVRCVRWRRPGAPLRPAPCGWFTVPKAKGSTLSSNSELPKR